MSFKIINFYTALDIFFKIAYFTKYVIFLPCMFLVVSVCLFFAFTLFSRMILLYHLS